MRAAMAPVFALRGDRARIARLERVLFGGPPPIAAPDLVSRVIAYMDAHEGAVSANAVRLAVGGRRADVQKVVRRLRPRYPRYPWPRAGIGRDSA
jgi:hypothetical protein